ncbi:uncharacterized protein G2W53_031213 [Senna tora]|uniref:Uncharacterized protein n=1 Tax=Senna tora TaxID=362788 RepID=A0A834TH13_9FABA|nr:uncharacterized protein G2W53_031213 [Senna tora]
MAFEGLDIRDCRTLVGDVEWRWVCRKEDVQVTMKIILVLSVGDLEAGGAFSLFF